MLGDMKRAICVFPLSQKKHGREGFKGGTDDGEERRRRRVSPSSNDGARRVVCDVEGLARTRKPTSHTHGPPPPSSHFPPFSSLSSPMSARRSHTPNTPRSRTHHRPFDMKASRRRLPHPTTKRMPLLSLVGYCFPLCRAPGHHGCPAALLCFFCYLAEEVRLPSAAVVDTLFALLLRRGRSAAVPMSTYVRGGRRGEVTLLLPDELAVKVQQNDG